MKQIFITTIFLLVLAAINYPASAEVPSDNTVAMTVSITGNTSACQGASVGYTATVIGNTGTPSYQWKKNGVNVTPDVTGTPANVGVFTTLNNNDVISCFVTTTTGQSALSNTITITITQPSSFNIGISLSPGPTLCQNAPITFTTTSGLSSYQWSMNGSAVAGATNSSFSTTAVSVAQLQSVSVTATSTGCVTNGSATASATNIPFVITPLATPTIFINGDDMSKPVCPGTSHTFIAYAYYFDGNGYINGNASFQWRVNGSNIASATSQVFTTATYFTGQQIDCIVTSNAGCITTPTVTSNAIVVNVVTAPTVGTLGAITGPTSTISQGTSNYSTSASNASSYNWSISPTTAGSIDDSGTVYWSNQTTSSTVTITATANGCNGPSAPSTLQITLIPIPLIPPMPPLSGSIILSNNVTINPGGNPGRIIAGSASGGSSAGNYQYQWQKSSNPSGPFTDIPGSTGKTHLPGAVSTTTYFQRKVTCGSDNALSNTTVVTTGTVSTTNQNYVLERIITRSGITDFTAAGQLTDPHDVRQTTSYFDGLGRPLQTVAKQESPLARDIVSTHVYDPFQRESVTLLAYTDANGDGNFKGSAANDQYNFNLTQFPGEQYYYNQTDFETSPLGRPLTTYAQGNSWVGAGRGVLAQYLFNTLADSVLIWNIAMANGSLPVSAGAYTAGQLNKNVSTDENGYQVVEYKDKDGHVILKKVQLALSPSTGHAGWAQTYYIYDDLGLLRFVLQPELSKTLVNSGGNPVQSDLDKFAFQYQYDGRQRMIQKQVPGAGAVYMVYDNRDRLVLTQDANQRAGATNAIKYWTFTKYDLLNRPVLTGIKDTTTATQLTQAQMQSVVDSYYSLMSTTKPWRKYGETFVGGTGTNIVHGYTNYAYPQVTTAALLNVNKYLTVTYYDNYNFVTSLALGTDFSYTAGEISGQEPLSNTAVVGHPTGSKINVLGTTSFLYSVNYYDSKYRSIQTTAQNNKGGWDRTTQVVDFTGKVLNAKTKHHTSSHTDLAVARRFRYDHAGRLLETYHQINSNPEILLSQNTYNEIGQLVKKNLHCTNCTDPAINQHTTAPGGAIVRSVYNSNEQTLLATQSVLLEPGYYVPNGSTMDAKVVSSNATIPGVGSSGTYMQSVDYRYNIRGWLQSMNNSQLANDGGITNSDTNDLFGMELGYNNSIGSGNSSMYNGNISGMKWSTNLALGMVKDVAYNYSYDPMNRITGASYRSNTSGVWANPTNSFNESGYNYDQNGNIKKLIRNGSAGSSMDNMTYAYNGNQLQSVSDAADKTKGFVDGANTGNDYTYDTNGNMVTDQNKSLTAANAIQYNYLNLPVQVTKSTNEKIIYTYDASGKKLMQQVYNASNALTKTTDYDGEFIYQGDTLQFINHEEGRIVMKGVTNPEYQYHLKDHLGNVRLTFTSQITTKTFKAGFETANQTTEANNFTNYPTSAKINTVATNAHSGANSYYLNGGYSGQVGLAKSLSVMPGDQVSIQAYAKYNTPSTTATNFTPFVASLLAAFNLAAPAAGEVGTPAAGVNTFGNWEIGATGDDSKGDAMKIFVTIIMFDRNYNFLDVAYQAIQGSGVMNATYKAKQAGYAYLYVSNEHPYLTDVYFDDVTVTFTPSPVVQQEDFYPFGLSFNSYSRENSVPDNYLFNEMELQKDLSLNWYDYGARQYDPAIGRFLSIDPHADNDRRWSPYVYAYDNPIRFIDPDGMDAEDTRPRGATVLEGDHTDRTITVTRSGADGETSHTITETNTTTNGSYQFDEDGNAVGWKETTNTTTSQTVLNENGDKVSSSQTTSKSENTFALNKGTQLSLFGSDKTVYSLGNKISGSSQTTTSNKISNASNEFKTVVSMTGDYSRMTNGLSITQTNTNWMMQSLSRNPTDSGLGDERSMAGLALPALFESNRTQTFYKSCGKSLLECKIHNDYLKAIRTGTAGYIKTK